MSISCNKLLAIERKYELSYLAALLSYFIDIELLEKASKTLNKGPLLGSSKVQAENKEKTMDIEINEKIMDLNLAN